MSRARKAYAALAIVVALASAAWCARSGDGDANATRCGPGFFAHGARCCPGEAAKAGDAPEDPDLCGAVITPAACPAPLAWEDGACLAPRTRVRVPETEVLVGPSDWEAEGRVPARRVRAGPFDLDAFEVTVGRLAGTELTGAFARERAAGDLARAVTSVTRAEAEAHCASWGGRLPTEAEWIVAAAGATARRYAWGDTGAVCRRAAFGLAKGPCASGAKGPDTVGARAAGATASTAIFDLTGNAAERIAAYDGASDAARGGSWRSALATELRTWAEIRVSAARDDRVGFRCAYDAVAEDARTK